MGFCPIFGIWQDAGTPATSQMRCWLLPNGRIFPAAAGILCAGLPYCTCIFHVARTLAQCWLFLSRRARTRCQGRKPHTAATRASRRVAGARRTRRVDRADLFHGRKIGTIGTFKGNPPFAVAAVGIRQNPFFSPVSVIGTAVSITFVMVIYMVYDIQTADLAPESHRSSMVYSSYGYSYRKSDHSNSNTGMSYRAVNAIFAELPGAGLVTYLGPTYLRYCGDSPVRGMRRTVRQVDLNYWRVYDIPLVAGRLFSTEEFDACRDDLVIGEQLAREAFGSAEAAIGKNYFVNFRPKRIVGVTKDVSSLFTFAYGELWMPYSTRDSGLGSEGLRGDFEAVALVKPGVGREELKRQIEQSLARFNEILVEYELELPDLSTYTERQFFRNDTMSPAVTCIILGLILLIVPAINVSGLISSQMSRRMAELAVRKAYGASRSTLMVQLLRENLALAFAGALLGFLFSCIFLWLGKDWMLGDGAPGTNFDVSVWLFLRPAVFVAVLVVCLLFNLLSVFIPAWHATRRPIAEVLGGE